MDSCNMGLINKVIRRLKTLSLWQRCLVGIVALVLCSLLFKGCSSGSSAESNSAEQLDRFYEVERGDFNITVLGRGELAAIENHQLRFEGKGSKGLSIIQLVENQAKVEVGDPVVSFADEVYLELIKEVEEELYDLKVDHEYSLEFQDELFVDDTRDLEENLDDIELNIVLFLETQGVARDKTVSVLTELANAHETAVDALDKYQNLEYRTESKKIQAAADDQEQSYYEAMDGFEKSKQVLSEARLKDDVTRDKATRVVVLDEKKVATSISAWENARKAERRFRRYDHPQKLRRLVIASDKTLLDLKRQLVKADSDQVQNERRYRKLLRQQEQAKELIVERRLKKEEKLVTLEEDFFKQQERSDGRLAELKDDYSKLVLRAPVAGIVEIGSGYKRGREPKLLAIGTQVAPQEVVARIPDLSQFLVNCAIPEIYRSRIQVGLDVIIKNSALPDLVMEGKVAQIASMSERLNRWDSRSPRIYKTTVGTNTTDPRLMPGMTVEIEILVDSVYDALFVPVEALYNQEGETYCQVKGTFGVEERLVETGRVSTSFVEVLVGIGEGDIVLLHRKDR
ncbi:MAG: HlyD family secretion protein [Lentimonas sp.]|jgi:HlyD family secretion protein